MIIGACVLALGCAVEDGDGFMHREYRSVCASVDDAGATVTFDVEFSRPWLTGCWKLESAGCVATLDVDGGRIELDAAARYFEYPDDACDPEDSRVNATASCSVPVLSGSYRVVAEGFDGELEASPSTTGEVCLDALWTGESASIESGISGEW